ncbi:MAG: type III pantothenate kinase [Oscillospiraceae bacterium]|nr:type III pantothenate kinase [Oscillospiraceae bacterium]
MILTVDVGNTNIVFIVFKGDERLFESRIDTSISRMADQYAVMLSDILRLYGVSQSAFTGAIISSVVPPVTRNIVAAIVNLLNIQSLVVEPGLKTGLNIEIDNPTELGADLVCGAVAVKTLYWQAGAPCIAVDLGTVTKLMVIGQDGALIGGVLAPGVGIGFDMMAAKTALLPLVGTEAVKHSVIGTNTPDCIRNGILCGAACMIDGLVERFEAELGVKSGECKVIATGGFASVILPYCKRDIEIDKILVSQGLRIIYNMNTY